MTKLLKVHLTRHLQAPNLISNTQHVFKENVAISQTFSSFFGEFNCTYDCTKPVDPLNLSFQKTFDKGPHERLITKVKAHEIQDNYSRWIRNWTTGRTQQVMIHDQASDWTRVTRVPKGSVLGPLLFIIYMNDFDAGIISKINKFADDSKLYHKAFTKRDKVGIQSDLNRLLQMSFTINKCSVMDVVANDLHFQHMMNDILIEAT
ncbi:Reverse transcriptase domain [Trinorchestia longiramus]|nr:Reverse transcriptase domain [Trinorchestia longiramus]